MSVSTTPHDALGEAIKMIPTDTGHHREREADVPGISGEHAGRKKNKSQPDSGLSRRSMYQD